VPLGSDRFLIRPPCVSLSLLGHMAPPWHGRGHWFKSSTAHQAFLDPGPPVRDLAFGVVGGYPVVEGGPRQHPGDESIERHTLHDTTLAWPVAAVNRQAPSGTSTGTPKRTIRAGLDHVPRTTKSVVGPRSKACGGRTAGFRVRW